MSYAKLSEMIANRKHFSREDVGAGVAPTLEEVLRNRELRVAFQKNLCTKYPNKTLIVLKVNMPGPVKNNDFVEYLLFIGKQKLISNLCSNGIETIYSKELSHSEALIFACVVDCIDAKRIKELTIDIEDNSDVGRFMDFDVFINETSISRTDVGYSTRSCYLCAKDAKNCSRNRTHSVEELHDYMYMIVNESR